MLLTLSEETRDLGSATKVEKRVRTRESAWHNVRNAGTSGQHNLLRRYIHVHLLPLILCTKQEQFVLERSAKLNLDSGRVD